MRSFLLGKKTEVKDVPYDYEVEYLESTGTQYIDTGCVPTWNSGFAVSGMRTDGASRTKAFSGVNEYVYDSSGTRYQAQFQLAPNGLNYIQFRYFETYKQIMKSSVASNFHKYEVKCENGLVTGYIDGVESVDGMQSIHVGSSPTLSIYLFALNNVNGTAIDNLIGRISSFKFYKDSVLSADFIPVAKEGKGMMYDKVSGSFFENSGTGDFIAGPRKEVA